MPEPSPAPRPRNPNRDLTANEVVKLFRRRLPSSMLSGLAADRNWIWWSGEKPDDATRAILVEIGFEFTKRDHTLPDGRVAHWYHACGGAVKRVGRSKRANSPAPTSGRDHSLSDHVVPETDTVASFLRLADSLA